MDFDDCPLSVWDDDSVNTYLPTRSIGWFNDTTVSIVDSTDINGESSHMIQFKYPAGTDEFQGGGVIYLDFERDCTEVYISFHMKFDGQEWGYNGFKLPGLLGHPKWAGVQAPGNNEGFLAYMSASHHGMNRAYVYHHDQVGSVGDLFEWGKFIFQTGRWYTITIRLVMNTFTVGVANQDGIYEGFVNKRKICGVYDLELMENEHDTMKIDGMYFTSFMAENTLGSYDDCYMLMDNIEIYYLDPTFCSNNGYAHGQNDTNSLGDTIYCPITVGSDVDTYDTEYTSHTGTFKDINGAGEYDAKTYEAHRIFVDNADSIVIMVDTVRVEDGFDLFQIIPGATTVTHSYTVSTLTDITETEYTVEGESAIIILSSDYSNQDKGFDLSYEGYHHRQYPYLKGIKQAPKLNGSIKKYILTK